MDNILDRLSEKGLVKQMVHSTPVSYLIVDEDYRLQFANIHHLRYRGLQAETTIGEICYNVSNGGVPCKECTVRRAFDTNEKAYSSRRDLMPNGNVCFLDDYAIPLPPNPLTGKRQALEIMVDRTAEMVARAQRDQRQNEVLSILSSLIDAKDSYTALHSQNVQTVAMKLARAMKLDDTEMFELSYAAILHDIGKVHIPNEILNKPTRLTDDEYETIKAHSVYSYAMLSGFATLDNIRRAVRYHHERWDGKGYPDGLTGLQTPLIARIIAVADTYDAMTSTRPYRKALTHEYAMSEIARVAGSQLDPDIVDVFLKMDFESDIPVSSSPVLIERELGAVPVYSGLAYGVSAEDEQIMDQSIVANAVLANSPCGYLLTDEAHNVVYANPYFLQYMSITAEELQGQTCAEAKGNYPSCANCPLARNVNGAVGTQMRQHNCHASSHKSFDTVSVPWYDEGVLKYMLKVVIDRTNEVLHERQKELDFEQLTDMLEQLASKQHALTEDARMAEELSVLRLRLQALRDMSSSYKQKKK